MKKISENIPFVVCSEIVNDHSLLTPNVKIMACSECEVPVYVSQSILKNIKKFIPICLICIKKEDPSSFQFEHLKEQAEEFEKATGNTFDQNSAVENFKKFLSS